MDEISLSNKLEDLEKERVNLLSSKERKIEEIEKLAGEYKKLLEDGQVKKVLEEKGHNKYTQIIQFIIGDLVSYFNPKETLDNWWDLKKYEGFNEEKERVSEWRKKLCLREINKEEKLTLENYYLDLFLKESKDELDWKICQYLGYALLYNDKNELTNNLDDLKSAKAYFEKVIELQPDLEDNYVCLAECIKKINEIEENKEWVNNYKIAFNLAGLYYNNKKNSSFYFLKNILNIFKKMENQDLRQLGFVNEKEVEEKEREIKNFYKHFCWGNIDKVDITNLEGFLNIAILEEDFSLEDKIATAVFFGKECLNNNNFSKAREYFLKAKNLIFKSKVEKKEEEEEKEEKLDCLINFCYFKEKKYDSVIDDYRETAIEGHYHALNLYFYLAAYLLSGGRKNRDWKACEEIAKKKFDLRYWQPNDPYFKKIKEELYPVIYQGKILK